MQGTAIFSAESCSHRTFAGTLRPTLPDFLGSERGGSKSVRQAGSKSVRNRFGIGSRFEIGSKSVRNRFKIGSKSVPKRFLPRNLENSFRTPFQTSVPERFSEQLCSPPYQLGGVHRLLLGLCRWQQERQRRHLRHVLQFGSQVFKVLLCHVQSGLAAQTLMDE